MDVITEAIEAHIDRLRDINRKVCGLWCLRCITTYIPAFMPTA